MIQKSCGAIIFHKNSNLEYLLLHYESGHWDLAKGHVEKGETEIDTAVREIKEETGLEVKILSGFRETIKYFFKDKGTLISKEVIFFVAQSKSKNVRLSQEHIGYEWLIFGDAIEKLTYKNAKDVLKKADKFLKGRLV